MLGGKDFSSKSELRRYAYELRSFIVFHVGRIDDSHNEKFENQK